MELVVEIVEVPPAPCVTVRLLRLLDVGVKLDEAVWPRGGVDLVAILTVKLGGKVIQKTVSLFFAELSLRQSEEARLLLNDIAKMIMFFFAILKIYLGLTGKESLRFQSRGSTVQDYSRSES